MRDSPINELQAVLAGCRVISAATVNTWPESLVGMTRPANLPANFEPPSFEDIPLEKQLLMLKLASIVLKNSVTEMIDLIHELENSLKELS